MTGRPKKRATAQKTAQSSPPVGESGGSGARARTAGGKAKASAKGKAPAKRVAKKGGKKRTPTPGRHRYEAANIADFEAYGKALEKAAAAADKAGALTPEERVERDTGIVAAWALGLRPATIAEQTEVPESTVHEVIRAHRERRAKLPIPASAELLDDVLDHLEALTERVSLLATASQTDAVKLGAMRTLHELIESRMGMLIATGRVSTRPSEVERARRARDMLRQLLDELRALEVPQDKLDLAARRVFEPHAGDDSTVTVLEGRATSR